MSVITHCNLLLVRYGLHPARHAVLNQNPDTNPNPNPRPLAPKV